MMSERQLLRAIKAMDAAGHPVRAMRVCANGDVLFLTEAPAGALPVADNDGGSDWTDLAGSKEVPRA